MKYIEQWLQGLNLEYIVPILKDNGIITPKKLAHLSIKDIYEIGVEDADDRKKLYFLIQRLQAILAKDQKKAAEDEKESDVQPEEEAEPQRARPPAQSSRPASRPPPPPPPANNNNSPKASQQSSQQAQLASKPKQNPLMRSVSPIEVPAQGVGAGKGWGQPVTNPQTSQTRMEKEQGMYGSDDEDSLEPASPPHEAFPQKKQSPIHPTHEAAAQVHANVASPPTSSAHSNAHIADMAIRVVVRKRPLSRSELGKGERDVMEVFDDGAVLVHEPKIKVDLTKIVESTEFIFDDAFECTETNELIYERTLKHLIYSVFDGGKATCFAYGQTGSGKTFTMMGSNPYSPSETTVNAGLYILAARDIVATANLPQFNNLKVLVSCFEIYGGKLFDLLNNRNLIKCLEDAQQQVHLPGLSEHVIHSVQDLMNLMGNAQHLRSTGATGANEQSSRSHQILQLSIKKEQVVAAPGRSSHRRASSAPPTTVLVEHGKFSFIDLAGSERGADTGNSSKQTRMEGAEINTSLLALKEVIRSLERKKGHTPFRGSKLTQVLKDSFVGSNTHTCMVACVSPSNLNCEHTINTLRYADRVKEHQSGGNPGQGNAVQGAINNSPPAAAVPSAPVSMARHQAQPSNRRESSSSRPATSDGSGRDRRIPAESKPPTASASSPRRGTANQSQRSSQPAHMPQRQQQQQPPAPLESAMTAMSIGKKSTDGRVNNDMNEGISPSPPRRNNRRYSEEDTTQQVLRPPSSHISKSSAPVPAKKPPVDMVQRTVQLLNAHKAAITLMVEDMKDEMDLVQNMEDTDDRDAESYVEMLSELLENKSNSVTQLRQELSDYKVCWHEHQQS